MKVLNSLEEIKAALIELPENTKAILLMKQGMVMKKGIDGLPSLFEGDFIPSNVRVALCYDLDCMKLVHLEKDPS